LMIGGMPSVVDFGGSKTRGKIQHLSVNHARMMKAVDGLIHGFETFDVDCV